LRFQLSIAKDLPRVGYTTFLDAPFLTSFTFIFFCIVEIVFVYVLQAKKRTALAETIRELPVGVSRSPMRDV